MKRILPLLCLTVLLSACGLRPVYSGGSHGAVAQALGNVEVQPIEGKGGWLVRNALNDRLAAMRGTGPGYKLVVKLDDDISGFGLRSDAAVTRERRTLRARYQLVDEATGAQILDDTAGSDVGIDVVSSEYATIAAEDTALERLSQTIADQIVARLARFAQGQQARDKSR
ncbi:LPS assembly lipoprotein LptE [Sphingobium sp. JS3065]|jgi:LPS-assembly lipoprotein|uniref:LPS assembly lipoprotein LptE n=1 Tax=Sphingobium sp. JS3065 TaxID=2970925 RepID=UPI002263D76C|nr:LPS assembly lipoprotein LptE [Sphingobium sp. JS3065]UZW54598.1 LPS assembly lipoprotein LptE [Sphingobium sp. JS3065]